MYIYSFHISRFPTFYLFWGWLYSNIQQWPSPTLHTKRLLRKPWMKPWPAIVQWFIDWTWWFPYCSYVKLPQGNLAPILHCPDLPRIRKDPNQNHVFAGAFNITGKGWLDMVVSIGFLKWGTPKINQNHGFQYILFQPKWSDFRWFGVPVGHLYVARKTASGATLFREYSWSAELIPTRCRASSDWAKLKGGFLV